MNHDGTRLTDLRQGETGIVVEVDVPTGKCRERERLLVRGAGGQGCAQRLTDLGLTPGARLTVVRSAPFKGPLEVMVRGSRIALGRAMASRILVEVTR